MTLPALLLLLLAVPPQDDGVRLPVEETVLDNGMRVLMVPRRQVPRVHCSLWWRVGSVHERPGITGLSHFFEHMMFMGTDVIGTTDPAKDAELNGKIEAVMSKIREIKLRRLEASRRGEKPPAEDDAAYAVLWKEYEGYVEEQKKITIPEHLSRILQSQGGTGVNANTSYDRTAYFVELPANKVELFFWLESDRFLKPVFRSFYPEREVVKEERRMRVDTAPTGLVEEAFGSAFWQAHSYRWPVLGWMSDIDEYTLADAKRYYETHYSPENCTAIFVGDFDPARIRELAKLYFGRLPRHEGGVDPIVTVEPRQPCERRMSAVADAPDEIDIRWHGPSGVHRDSAACDLLMGVFAGRSGRLYRPMVEDRKLALGVDSWYWSLRYGGVLHLGAVPREGADPAEVEKEIMARVEDVRKNGIGERELDKVRNQQTADLMRGLDDYGGIANQLGYFETIGTYRDFFDYVDRLKIVTAADVKRCAERYLAPEGMNVLTVRRKGKQE